MQQWIVEHIVFGWYTVTNQWFGTKDLGVCDDFGNLVERAPLASAVAFADQDH